MASTFEDVLKSYVRRIGEVWGNTTEDIEGEMIPRLNENYLALLRDTGASWQPPTTLTLTAVTQTANKHRLTTALSASDGEVLSVDTFTYKGVPLLVWDKKKIDGQHDILDGSSFGDQYAYAFWGEHDTTLDDEATYIALFPYLDADNSSDFKMTWIKRPDAITTSNYTTTYPIFANQFCDVLAERMALEWFDMPGRVSPGTRRLIKYENESTKMRNHYLDYRISLMGREPRNNLHYGESWDDFLR